MKPGRASALLAAIAGLVSVAASGVTMLATIAGGAGLACLLGGVLLDRSAGVAVGGLGLAAAIGLAGQGSVGTAALVLAAVTAALAYDLGDTALETRRSFDDEAATLRGEGVHALGTALLLGLTGGGAYLVFEVTAGRGSALAVAALLVGAASLMAATRV